jgi:senataxin
VARKMNRLLREESEMSGGKDKLYRVIRVVDKMEAMASYWALNKDRFAPSSLERTVFSWSIEDIFNRDLLRHQVP